MAERREGGRHVEVAAVGQDTLGLFEDDPAVEGVLELFADDGLVRGGTVLDEGDGRDVGEGLGEAEVCLVERARSCTEQVEGPDHVVAQAHGDGVHAGHPGLGGDGRELGPPVRLGGEVRDVHRVAVEVAGVARALRALGLERLEVRHALGRGSDDVQHPAPVGEQQPDGADVEQAGAVRRELGEQLVDVVALGEAAGHRHERRDDVVLALTHDVASCAPPVSRQSSLSSTRRRSRIW